MAGSIPQMEAGWLLIISIRFGFLVCSFMQAKTARAAHFMHRISVRLPAIATPLGRAGHSSRAVVFLLIGWSMVRIARAEEEERRRPR